ncbi:MAG: hydrogen peroxide-inducible genes activator [Gammaproteobacteria bacterium]|nr:hydrogen peroxide-inducible genes activator [Gammaproteobacteria bacterium]MCP5196039.1 hydrogen peroxide-inducible genes activator [Gammaproteobacteria bacterium]
MFLSELHVTLQELRYLVAVAEEQHFGRAAELCHVTQSTLSIQLKKLEDQLNVILFDRSQPQATPTPVGREIIAQARLVLEEAHRVQAIALRGLDPMQGVLRVGVIPTLGPYLIPHLLLPIHAAYPKLRMFLREDLTDHLLRQLRSGELDLLLMALPVRREGLETLTLFAEPFQVALPAGHPLTERDQIEESDLSDYEILLLEEGHCLRDQALAICQSPKVIEDFTASSLETLRQMVAAGIGLTLLPELAARLDQAAAYRQLIEIRAFAPPAPTRTIGLVWRRQFPRQATIDGLVEVIQKHLPPGLSK